MSRNGNSLWPELPTNMMISVTVKPQDRRKEMDAVCYLAVRVRVLGGRGRDYKEFGGLNEDNYEDKIAEGVAWLEKKNQFKMPPFDPPAWEQVLRRLNIRQEVKTVKKFQFYDQRVYSP